VRENETEKNQGDRNVVKGTAYVIAMGETKKNCIAWKVSGQSLLVLLEKVSWK